MNFKLIIVSIACCTFLAQPAHSFGFESLVGDIIAIPVKLGTDVAASLTIGAGKKVQAMADTVSSISGAISNGIISAGNTVSKAGNIIASTLNNPILGTRALVEVSPVKEVVEEVDINRPTVMELAFLQPREQDIIEVDSLPLRSVLKVREPTAVIESVPGVSFVPNKVSAVWNTLNTANVNNKAQNVNKKNQPSSNRVVYEIIETPMIYEKPWVEAFQIQKK